jgi:CheY-like chemotaxis protein
MPSVRRTNWVTATRVLLVEDEGVIRLVTGDALRDEGFEVIEAWNGDEGALMLDGPDHIDVLFTDVRMPGSLDGLDLAKLARRRFPTLPVLVVSGYAENLASRLAELNPPATFMGKPYDLTAVARALRRLADGS